MNPRFPGAHRPWSQNGALASAAAAFAEDPNPEHREALFRSLRQGPLLVAWRELPPSPAVHCGVTVEFVCNDDTEGGPAICVFSSPQAATARAPAGLWLAVEPTPVLTWIFAEELGSIVIDPEGPAVRLSRDQIGRLLGLTPPRPVGPLSRSGPDENRVREALARLIARPQPGAHVVVTEPRTGKSVVFERAPDGSLMMLVRAASLSHDEATRCSMMFAELAGEDACAVGLQPRGASGDWADFQALFSGDPGQAAKATLKIFTWAFEFPLGFGLELQER